MLQEMPDFLPDRLEAGTHNVPGAAGLLEGLRFVQRKGTAHILEHERRLAAQCVRALSSIKGVEVYAEPQLARQAGVVSFRVGGIDCEEVGTYLARQGIAVRSELHCAPLAHRTVGTLETGTVRVSFSAFNMPGEVRSLVQAVSHLHVL